MFYVLSGSAEFRCDGQAFPAGPGGVVGGAAVSKKMR
jgi:hypothetical protein